MRILTFVSIVSFLIGSTERDLVFGTYYNKSSSSSSFSSFSSSSSSFSSSSNGRPKSQSSFQSSQKSKDVKDGKVRERSLDLSSIPGSNKAFKAVFDENNNG